LGLGFGDETVVRDLRDATTRPRAVAARRTCCQVSARPQKIINPFGSTDAITLEHLLSHTSGLQSASYPDPIQLGGTWSLWNEIERGIPRIKAEAPLAERYFYFNLGFMLLGRIVELVTRDEWESYATKNILMPLGMREAYFDQTPYHLAGRRAESYGKKGEPLGIDMDHGATTSNGGLKACFRDMARFAQFLLKPECAAVLSRATFQEMFRPRYTIGPDSEVALAFHILKFPRHSLVGHNGAAAGFRAAVWCALEAEVALLIAANTATARPLLADACRSLAEQL
jgi:CubicO group peptidase (beta-lactamase class C family)